MRSAHALPADERKHVSQMFSLDSLVALARRRTDALLGSLILIVSFGVFRIAPVQQAGDSLYSMLLAENLIHHGDFTLERYHLPEVDYRLESAGGHRYYTFPPGTSVLSVPFVAAMSLRGMSALRRDGTYSVRGERAVDAWLAALVMAAFASLVYFTSRLLVPPGWSAAITFVAAFGTQVLSTTSRAMWSDTWGIFLVVLVVFLLLKAAARGEGPNLLLLATLESWAYFVRPTNSLVLAATTAYLVARHRERLWMFLLAVAGWMGLFFAYSWRLFHRILPRYFEAGRLAWSATSWDALSGNLVSPSRGLLVYVPALIAVALVLARFWRTLRFRAIALLATTVLIAHVCMLGGFVHWWGGYSYGARLTASLVPWFAVLAVLAVDAARRADGAAMRSAASRATVIVAGLLCGVSVAINAVGAFSENAWQWNSSPEDIDQSPDRLWSWRNAQFLAPISAPSPSFPTMITSEIQVGTVEAEPYLGPGWSFPEGSFRWTDSRDGAVIRFSLPTRQRGTIELDLRPYLGPPLRVQRLILSVNDHEIATLALRSAGFATYRFAVPAGVATLENVVRLRLPDAASPAALEGSGDPRQLGVAVRAFRWRSGDVPSADRDSAPPG
jgi:hypothetical protein